MLTPWCSENEWRAVDIFTESCIFTDVVNNRPIVNIKGPSWPGRSSGSSRTSRASTSWWSPTARKEGALTWSFARATSPTSWRSRHSGRPMRRPPASSPSTPASSRATSTSSSSPSPRPKRLAGCWRRRGSPSSTASGTCGSSFPACSSGPRAGQPAPSRPDRPASRPPASPAGRGSRRRLSLRTRREWRVNDLAAEAHVSAGLAHRVLARLERENLVAAEGAGPQRVPTRRPTRRRFSTSGPRRCAIARSRRCVPSVWRAIPGTQAEAISKALDKGEHRARRHGGGRCRAARAVHHGDSRHRRVGHRDDATGRRVTAAGRKRSTRAQHPAASSGRGRGSRVPPEG